MLRDFSGGMIAGGSTTTVAGSISANTIIGACGLVIAAIGLAINVYYRRKDSRALHEALKRNDLAGAINVRNKLGR